MLLDKAGVPPGQSGWNCSFPSEKIQLLAYSGLLKINEMSPSFMGVRRVSFAQVRFLRCIATDLNKCCTSTGQIHDIRYSFSARQCDIPMANLGLYWSKNVQSLQEFLVALDRKTSLWTGVMTNMKYLDQNAHCCLCIPCISTKRT